MHGWMRCSSAPCTEGQKVEIKDSIEECAESANLEGGRMVRPVLVTIGGCTIIGSSTTLGDGGAPCVSSLEGISGSSSY